MNVLIVVGRNSLSKLFLGSEAVVQFIYPVALPSNLSLEGSVTLIFFERPLFSNVVYRMVQL